MTTPDTAPIPTQFDHLNDPDLTPEQRYQEALRTMMGAVGITLETIETLEAAHSTSRASDPRAGLARREDNTSWRKPFPHRVGVLTAQYVTLEAAS